MAWRVGDTVRFWASFRDSDGRGVDGLNPKVTIYDPSNNTEVDAQTMTGKGGGSGFYWYDQAVDERGGWPFWATDLTDTVKQDAAGMIPVGYSLTSFVAAIWNALTSGFSTSGSAGKLLADNLDDAVTSRASATDYTSGRAAKLDNLDGAVSDVPTAVWAAGTRTLSSFGTLVADIVAAITASASLIAAVSAGVWAYASRTLTSLSGLLSSGMVATSGTPIGTTVSIYQGDAYTADSPNGAITITDTSLGDLSGLELSVVAVGALANGLDFFTSAVGGSNTLTFELTSAETASFDVAKTASFVLYVFIVDAGKESTKVIGELSVSRLDAEERESS